MMNRNAGFCRGCFQRRLEASQSPCSICGREWTLPRNPESFATRATRWLLRPLGWFTHTVTIIVALCFLWAATTHSTSNLIFLIFAFSLCLFIIVTWLGRALARFIVAAFFQRGGWAYPGWRNWLLAPLAALLVTFLLRHDVPMRAAFFVSRPAMTRLAQRILKLPPKAKLPMEVRVGRYRATDIERFRGGVRFNVANNAFTGQDYFGFAYFPKGKPSVSDDKLGPGRDTYYAHYTHLSGNWYSFRDHWLF